MGGLGHPLFYPDFFRGEFIEAFNTPVFSSLFGVCVGSFLNVCLSRWKNGGQIFSPPSFCPNCETPIRWYDNIPLLSYVLLRGKCRNCRKPISFYYPLIEFITGLLFLISFDFFHKDLFHLYFTFLLVSFLVLFTISDIRWRLLPHIFNNIFSLVGVVYKVFQFFMFKSEVFTSVGHFIVVGAVMVCLTRLVPDGLGGGDIKMAAGTVFWVGLFNAVCVLFIASIMALTLFLILFSIKKVTWKWMMPFGPFLALGTIVTWFFPMLVSHLIKIY